MLPQNRLGFGSAAIGNLYTTVDPSTAQQAVETAWENGIRYFDTAPHYGLGLAEKRLGAALAQYPRDDYVLSSKVGRLLVPAHQRSAVEHGFEVDEPLRRVWDFSRDGVLRSIEQSLTRLSTDRLDIVYLHDPDDHWPQAVGEAAPALAGLRDQGVIRAFGAGMNQSAMLTRFVRETSVDVVLLAGRLTLLDSSATKDLLPAAREHDVTVVAAGVFNSGLLARPRPAQNAKYDYVQAPAELITRARAIADVCTTHGVTLPEAAIAYPLRFSEVTSVLLGMRSPTEVTENVRCYEVSVPEALWEDLAGKGLTGA
ncbi:aldo/keto reductase [Kineosporia babensis]|uniref:Aldo/keto reductase n=1 Tax=Kineosporia babensis TaxID=499548 RepID=A0A9X1NK16_9ACTN|nr:aldo/keto reductase [Kineosporia babensis]MCD5316412.1 aldo/keto reductase [Kineosporia babensis]